MKWNFWNSILGVLQAEDRNIWGDESGVEASLLQGPSHPPECQPLLPSQAGFQALAKTKGQGDPTKNSFIYNISYEEYQPTISF